ncbi:MAG TPA: methylated-DNA--[protein]-cysteine S-methyltransferase [Rectinemataceae bacterium]|nr:methylated-DNA--[protein]-cysteine S-methyltransferase [Rectinemataceae bacterium]
MNQTLFDDDASFPREEDSAPAIPLAEMEKAFFSRDASYDGLFFTGVTTTGIFCRPSCPAKKPLPGNAVYFARASEALFSGYRPCKRCTPLSSSSDPAWVAGLVAEVEAEPSRRIREAELRERGLDPATVRRRFMSRFGLSFNAFQRARRLAAAFEDIKGGSSIDDAVFEHGYESHAGFREAFSRLFGSTPGEIAKGKGDFVRIAWIESALGPLIAGATDRGIVLLEFSDRRMMEAQALTLARRLSLPIAPGRNAHLDSLEAQLAEYFAGARRDFDLPLHEPGTPFQERVWSALRSIPCGVTWSYAELAKAIGEPSATRAVARANGMNRIAILVPCHRVIGADGGLGGYGGGIWRKKVLLDLESRMAGPS